MDKEKYLKDWIKKIVKNEKNTELAIKRHIVYHAKQVYEKDPALWSASMKNLTEMFELFYGIKPNIETRIERLENKYRKNPKRYTPPPK